MRCLVLLLTIFVTVATAGDEKPAGPYEGWTPEQFTADRSKKGAELRARAEAWFEVRQSMLETCKSCGGKGRKVSQGKEVPCDTCLGTGGDVPRDWDVAPFFSFHYGHDRDEAAGGRLALQQLLPNKRIFAVLLPLDRAEIREVRIDGDRGIVIAAVHRSNIPHYMRLPPDHVDVSNWIRADGKWWLLDRVLLGQMPKLGVPDPVRYPEAERPRPRHDPKAVALLGSAAGMIARSPLAEGQDISLTVKVRPPGAKSDTKAEVATSEKGELVVEMKGFKGPPRQKEKWQGWIGRPLGLVLETPVLPEPAKFHLRIAEKNPRAVIGEGFDADHALTSFTAEFGEDGLPVQVTWRGLRSRWTRLTSFVEKKETRLLSRLSLIFDDEMEELEVEWKRVKDWWLPTKISQKRRAEKWEGELEFRISGHRVTPRKE